MARRTKVLLAVFSLLTSASAFSASNPLGFYAGAGLGDANPPDTYQYPLAEVTGQGPFSGHDLGWDALVGIRPIRWLGAEFQYLDFGQDHIGSSTDSYGASPDTLNGIDGHTYAAAAFAVGYLPLPWRSPSLDLFGKVGVAKLWTAYHYSGNYPNLSTSNCNAAGHCTSSPLGYFSGSAHNNENDLAYGGGLQVHFGTLAVRVEYDALDSSLGDPNLFSVGVLWTP